MVSVLKIIFRSTLAAVPTVHELANQENQGIQCNRVRMKTKGFDQARHGEGEGEIEFLQLLEFHGTSEVYICMAHGIPWVPWYFRDIYIYSTYIS